MRTVGGGERGGRWAETLSRVQGPDCAVAGAARGAPSVYTRTRVGVEMRKQVA
jgi:hypothetical protein